MKFCFFILLLASAAGAAAQPDRNADFEIFKTTFLDAWWQQNPGGAIGAGYGKYYERLEIPSVESVKKSSEFAKTWLAKLSNFKPAELSVSNDISRQILQNNFEKALWYNDTFKMQYSDASRYNIGGSCYGILTQLYAPPENRLLTIAERLKDVPAYYEAALKMITNPTKAHTELGIRQNEGAITVFGAAFQDSVKNSSLTAAQKEFVQSRVATAIVAIKKYITGLKAILANPDQQYRDYRIGKEMYARKFYHDLVTDYSPERIYKTAVAAKKRYHSEMFTYADRLWDKYCSKTTRPADSLLLIKTVIEKISLNHVSPVNLFDTLNKQVFDLKKFIIQKDLFDFDTTAPIVVRKTPAFAAGVALASANFPLPYQKTSTAFYNINDLTAYPPEKAESQLREHNDYILQILSIHEAVPGHCLQGIYNARKSPDIIKSVFSNSPMAEGWAVYSERMMLENGWANDSPEMWLMYYKWSLRIAANTILDYGIHNLNYTKDKVTNLLRNETFQEEAQVEEKYNRATLTQVQLCSYFTGATEIWDLRRAYETQQGPRFTLKDFHESFLGYGTAPVKYIRAAMMR